MLGAKDTLEDGEQGGVLVASPVRVPSLPGPASKIATGDEGAGVLGMQESKSASCVTGDRLKDQLDRGYSQIPGFAGIISLLETLARRNMKAWLRPFRKPRDRSAGHWR